MIVNHLTADQNTALACLADAAVAIHSAEETLQRLGDAPTANYLRGIFDVVTSVRNKLTARWLPAQPPAAPIENDDDFGAGTER